MSGKSRRQAPEVPADGTGTMARTLDDGEPLLATVERAMDDLAQRARVPRGSATRYAQGFPVGEALGLLYCQRCHDARQPQGLALLIEHMLACSAENEPDSARRALFSGFCWQLEQMLLAR